MSIISIEKESDELLYTVWSLVAMHVENILFQNDNIFSVLTILKYNPGKTNNKLITSQSFLSSDIVPDKLERKRKRRNCIVYGSVTRYGPQSVARAKWLNYRELSPVTLFVVTFEAVAISVKDDRDLLVHTFRT